MVTHTHTLGYCRIDLNRPNGSYLSVNRFQSCGRRSRKNVITLREFLRWTRVHLEQSVWMASGSICLRPSPSRLHGPSFSRQLTYDLSWRSLPNTDSRLGAGFVCCGETPTDGIGADTDIGAIGRCALYAQQRQNHGADDDGRSGGYFVHGHDETTGCCVDTLTEPFRVCVLCVLHWQQLTGQ